MKKLLLLAASLALSAGAWANTPYKATIECQFDYDDFDFCSKANIAKYKNALKTQTPNFDKKYILLNVSNSSEFIRFVALDIKNGLALPLRDAILGFKDNRGGLNVKTPVKIYSFKCNQPLYDYSVCDIREKLWHSFNIKRCNHRI